MPLQRCNYKIAALHVPHPRTRSAALHSVSTAAALRPLRAVMQLCCLWHVSIANAFCRMCIVHCVFDVNQHGLWQELLEASLPLANAAQVSQQTPSVLCILTFNFHECMQCATCVLLGHRGSEILYTELDHNDLCETKFDSY